MMYKGKKIIFLLFIVAIPYRLWAIPTAIAQIIKQLEADKRYKKGKTSQRKGDVGSTADTAEASVDASDASLEPLDEVPALTGLEQACLRIDDAIQDSKLAKHPATWYYRGVIYEQLLKDTITSSASSASFLLNEALSAYAQVKKLSRPVTQFYSFALAKIAALWSYYLGRGIRYAEHEAFDQAIDCFAICRRMLPEEPTPLLYTAIVQQRNRQVEEAIHNYETYLQLQGPQAAIARVMAAIYYTQLEKLDQAIALLDNALIKFPFENELLEEQYLLYKTVHQLPTYEAALVEALQSQVMTKQYAYGYFLEHEGRIEEAVYWYQQILQAIPNQYEVLRQMGLLWYNEAIKTYAVVQKLGAKRKPVTAFRQPCIRVIARLTIPSYCTRLAFTTYELFDDSQSNWELSLCDQVKADAIPYTSPLFLLVKQQIAAELERYKRMQLILEVEQCLRKSFFYLQKAHVQDKKDIVVAQALYYSYYRLRKYRSAYWILHALRNQRHYLSAADDPFIAAAESQTDGSLLL